MSKVQPTRYDLVKIAKHPGYYVSPTSGLITYRRSIGGKPLKIRTGKTKIGEAKTFVEAKLEQMRTGSTEQAAKRKLRGVTNTPIKELHEEVVEARSPGKAESTIVGYGVIWRNGIEPFWGQKTLADVTPAAITEYRRWYLSEHPGRLFEHTLDQFKMMLKFAVQRKYLAAMPDLSELKSIDVSVKRNVRYEDPGRVFTDDEQIALLSVWKTFLPTGKEKTAFSAELKTKQAAWIRLAIFLGLRRGLRLREILALEWKRVNFKKEVLQAWSFKNKKWRDIPIDDDLKEALLYLLQNSKSSDYLFPRVQDPSRHVSNQLFDKLWYRARKEAGIVPVKPGDARFHDLRKTCATLTARLGWPIKAACELLDMSVATYSKVYANDVGLKAKADLIRKGFGVGS